jgi:hypothetical protein
MLVRTKVVTCGVKKPPLHPSPSGKEKSENSAFIKKCVSVFLCTNVAQ